MGKTYSIQKFGRENFNNFLTVSLEKNQAISLEFPIDFLLTESLENVKKGRQAGVAKLVDALDSKSSGTFSSVWVRIPPPAPDLP